MITVIIKTALLFLSYSANGIMAPTNNACLSHLWKSLMADMVGPGLKIGYALTPGSGIKGMVLLRRNAKGLGVRLVQNLLNVPKVRRFITDTVNYHVDIAAQC